MKAEERPKYNMWQNTGFMMNISWNTYKSVLLLSIVLAGIMGAKAITELLIAPVILEKIESEAQLSEVFSTIIIFSAILFLLSGLIGYIETNTLFGRVQIRLELTEKIGSKLADTAYTNLLNTKFLEYASKADEACSDNNSPTEHIWTIWTQIWANIIGFAAYMAVLSSLNLFLTGVIIIITLAGYFVNQKVSEWNYRHKEEEADALKRMNYVQNIATNREYAKDIRVFGQKMWLDDVWCSAMNLYKGFITRREKNYFLINVADLCMAFLRNGVAYTYLLWMTLTKGMSASDFLLYINAASGFSQWMIGILNQLNQLNRESLDLCVLREFLEWPEPFSLDSGKHIEKEEGKTYEIRLENVSYKYPDASSDTIKNMNLVIRGGEKLAIVGLNGAGKTTLVKLICGFLEPAQGRILLNGTDIKTYNRRDYYTLFSAVFQDFSVLEATISENVAQSVNNIDEDLVMRCLQQAGLGEMMNHWPKGLNTHVGRQVFEDGVELSGGQLQRLMLARALYKNGTILILDEPTAALDPIAENDIYMKYSEMTEGKTSVFISHRLASTRFCDRILFLEDGRIGQEGTHDELMASGGGYAHLFEVQSRYYKETEKGDTDGK